MNDEKHSRDKLFKPERSNLDAWIRSAAGAIPWVGTAVGELLTYRWTQVREERLEEAFQEIARRIESLGEDKLDKTYVSSDAFMHILVICFEGLIREHDDRKRRFFVSLLVNSMTAEMKDKRSRADWFASVLGRMSYFHLLGFSLIVADVAQRARLLDDISSQQGDFRAVAACLKDLESAGFITDFPLAGDARTDKHIVLGIIQSVTLTTSGSEFVEWVSARPNASAARS